MAMKQTSDASPKWESNNGGVGAALLRLGKLGSPCSEMLVIEAPSPNAAPHIATGRGLCTRGSHHLKDWKEEITKVELQERSIVERDLQLEEYKSEDEEEWKDIVAGLPPPWAPGSAVGRKLMKARARQCVICLTEKEHTLVPPHQQKLQRVEGHRFCTDCWADFLQHTLNQQGGLVTPACPVCRGAIDVPDVWCVDFELPESWCGGKGLRSTSSTAGRTPRASETWRQHQVPGPEFWADVAPGALAECRRRSGGRPGQDVTKWRTAFCWSMDRCVERLNRLLHTSPVAASSVTDSPARRQLH